MSFSKNLNKLLLLGVILVTANVKGMETKDLDDEWVQAVPLSDRLLVAEHLISTNQVMNIFHLFSDEELDSDIGVKYFVGLSKLITKQDPDSGAKLIEESAMNGYSDAIGLIEFACNMDVPSGLSDKVEGALKSLVW